MWRMAYRTGFVGLALLLPLAGCSEPLGSMGGEDARLSLDPADLQIGEVLYGCAGWKDGQEPTAERLVVDVFFVAPDAHRSATPQEERWVTDHGGRILHRHHLPAVRAEIPTTAIPDLVGHPTEPPVNHVLTVPDPGRQDVVVLILFTRPDDEEDVKRIEDLGGRVRYFYPATPGLLAVEIPDRALPALRTIPEVRSIGMNLVPCLGV